VEDSVRCGRLAVDGKWGIDESLSF